MAFKALLYVYLSNKAVPNKKEEHDQLLQHNRSCSNQVYACVRVHTQARMHTHTHTHIIYVRTYYYTRLTAAAS